MNLGVCQSLASLRQTSVDTDPSADCRELDPWHSDHKECDLATHARLPRCVVRAEDKAEFRRHALDNAAAVKAIEKLASNRAAGGCNPPWRTRQFYDDLRGASV